jgi:hypothetical protein
MSPHLRSVTPKSPGLLLRQMFAREHARMNTALRLLDCDCSRRPNATIAWKPPGAVVSFHGGRSSAKGRGRVLPNDSGCTESNQRNEPPPLCLEALLNRPGEIRERVRLTLQVMGRDRFPISAGVAFAFLLLLGASAAATAQDLRIVNH